MGMSASGNRLTVEASYLGAWALSSCTRTAKSVLPVYQGDTYDIAARAQADGASNKDEFRQMLQALLVDRFKEVREMPVYALVVGREWIEAQGPRARCRPYGPSRQRLQLYGHKAKGHDG
jgi:uncharacterized protein (TIGR03435 family)